MQSIICPHCKEQFEITQALREEVAEKVRLEERQSIEKKLREESELERKKDAQEKIQYRERIDKLMKDVLSANEKMAQFQRKDEEREIENQKKLQQERQKMQEEISKSEVEKARLPIAEMAKKLEDTQKALIEAQRKSEQGSQQQQGEVIELELESTLRNSFPHDEIVPIGKGVHGADIRQIVKSPRGFVCGTILWESKQTKHWDDKWIEKLKDDMRAEHANIPVIVTSAFPRNMTNVGVQNGVWIISHGVILPLAELFRKNLLDVGFQKVARANSTEKAEILYNYVISHKFIQQVEAIIEIYQNMRQQVVKERMAYEKMWKIREEQIEKISRSTVQIIGSIQGKAGALMPSIKGLEFLEE